jgi:putative ABC transport system permease protein
MLALLAIILGVALGFGVHLLNSSALAEFGSAAASLSGKPDLVVRADPGRSLEAAYADIARLPGVALAAPVLEGQAQASAADGKVFSLRIIGQDVLQSAALTPELTPQADKPASSMTWLLDPQPLYLNDAATRRLPAAADNIALRVAAADSGSARTVTLPRGGRVSATGPPLAVLDIAGAQVLLGRLGELDRIDLRLQTGQTPQAWLARNAPLLPAGIHATAPPDEGARLGDLTRAYRVNLGVLSLMALFTGGFLVFAVMSLSVTQRLPQLALLGVLGMSGRERASLVMVEGLCLGLLGSAAGLALGWGLAQLGLRILGADLGLAGPSGQGVSLSLTTGHGVAALVFGGLGVSISLVSAALPALAVQKMPVAQVLKGLGSELHPALPLWVGPALLLLGLGLALLPPFAPDSALVGMPLAAYASMLSLLLGGIACVPQLLRLAVGLLAGLPQTLAVQLVRERARDQAGEASRALAGVLVALSLSVAMLVMVGSFRASLDQWLTQVLPADIYLRSSLKVASAYATQQNAPLPPAYIEAVRQHPVTGRLLTQRSGLLLLDGVAEPLAFQARALDEKNLPLASRLANAVPTAPSGAVAIYINEALRDSLSLQPGQPLTLRLSPDGPPLNGYVRAVWRDYARQSGALLLPLADYQRWSGDPRITELYLWLAAGVAPQQGVAALNGLLDPSHQAAAAASAGLGGLQARDVELAEVGELRALSLRIFDRSFAITVWLQAVALGIGLFGIAASQSAQVLARKREFGLLLHLGLTRGGILRLLGLEAALLSGVGALAGLGLGLGLSAVLIWVVNPQSFHWTMDMTLPWPRLAGLVAAVFIAGVAAALAAGRKAASADAVQAVKEDW